MSNVSSTVSCCLPPPQEPIIFDPVKPKPFNPIGYSIEEFSFPTTLPTISIPHEILNKSITKFYLGIIDHQNKDKFFFAKLLFEEDILPDLSSLKSLQPHESLHDRAKEISSNVPRCSHFAHKLDSSSTQKKELASAK